MPQLSDLIPDAKLVVEMHPGDLAGYVLEILMTAPSEGGKWHIQNFCSVAGQGYVARGEGPHKGVMHACAEAWSWLESNGLICSDPEQPTRCIPTRRARTVRDRQAVKALTASQELPEHFLHPEIVLHARSLFLQGRLDTAVFEAFKSVEVAIREAGGLGNDLVGIKLAQRAFHPDDGPLTDLNGEPGERVALHNLMVGALGSFKNPSSHRRVALSASDARELLMLASHLLKIVEWRRTLT